MDRLALLPGEDGRVVVTERKSEIALVVERDKGLGARNEDVAADIELLFVQE